MHESLAFRFRSRDHRAPPTGRPDSSRKEPAVTSSIINMLSLVVVTVTLAIGQLLF
jgi:hypothetical protein